MTGFDLPVVQLFGVDIVGFTVTLGIFFAIYLIITLSLNLEFGYTGIPNFGKLLFVAGGAALTSSLVGRLLVYTLVPSFSGNYVFASLLLMTTKVDPFLASSAFYSILILLLSLAVGGLVGAGFGYLWSYPAIRLREDYLAMLLLASAQFLTIFMTAYDPLIGGFGGVGSPDPFQWGGSGLGIRDLTALASIAAVAVVVYIYCERVARSPLGRTLRGIRDNEMASEALGKDIVVFRRKVLVIGSGICGMAGALYTLYSGYNNSLVWTRFDWTIIPWVMVILGGAGNNWGTALGTLTFASIIKVMAQAKVSFTGLTIPVVALSNTGSLLVRSMGLDLNRVEYIAVGVALVLVLYLRPDGIIREKSTFTISRTRLRGILERGKTGGTTNAPTAEPTTTLSEKGGQDPTGQDRNPRGYWRKLPFRKGRKRENASKTLSLSDGNRDTNS